MLLPLRRVLLIACCLFHSSPLLSGSEIEPSELMEAKSTTADTTIVFDSITDGSFDGGNFLGFTIEAGTVINLAGSERTINRFEVVLTGGNSLQLVSAMDFRIHFRELDGPDGVPGTEIWTSPLVSIDLPGGTNQIAKIDVPNVVVPDMFAWTLEDIVQVRTAGMRFAAAPSIGSNGGFVQLNDFNTASGGEWRRSDPNPAGRGYGVRLTAVIPEPTSALLFMIGLASLASRRFARVQIE